MKEKSLVTKNSGKDINFIYIFGKASKICFKIMFIPVILLYFGLFIDKKLDTTPIFLAVGFVTGIFFASVKFLKLKRLF